MLSMDFIEYLQYWGVDLDILFVFSLSIIISFAVFYIALYFGAKYGETLDNAVDKVKRGRYDLLTKKERNVWEEFEEYKFNTFYK